MISVGLMDVVSKISLRFKIIKTSYTRILSLTVLLLSSATITQAQASLGLIDETDSKDFVAHYLQFYLNGHHVESLSETAEKAQATISRNYSVIDKSTASEGLELALEQFVQRARLALNMKDDFGKKFIATYHADRQSLLALRPEFMQLLAQHALYLKRFERVEAQLEIQSGTEYLEKLRLQRAEYQARINPVITALQALFHTNNRASSTDGETGLSAWLSTQTEALSDRYSIYQWVDAVAELSEWVTPIDAPILRAKVLPVRSLDQDALSPSTSPTYIPSYLQPTLDAVNAADLQAAGEVVFTDAIREKAEALEFDAIKIVDFVRNQIRTQWYAGAMKGADGTLAQAAGNYVDQSALLIALLRASSIPARYIHGVVEMPVTLLQSQLGVADDTAVVQAIRRAGIPYSPIIRGGRVDALALEYTWVSARIPYANYRGATVDYSGLTWLPLMPAVEEVDHLSTDGIISAANIDLEALSQSYLQTVNLQAPLDDLKARIDSYLTNAGQETTHADYLNQPSIIPLATGFVPNSLPLSVIAVTAESPTLNDDQRHWVQLQIHQNADRNSPAVIDLTLPLSAVASHRVTLSYAAGTLDSQNVINQFGGLGGVPAYLVDLRPQIKVDGQLKATATDVISMAAEHLVELTLTSPRATETVSKIAYAGGYHALAFSAQQVVNSPLALNNETLAGDTENRAAQLLSQLGLRYIQQWDQSDAELADLAGVALIKPMPTAVIVSNAIIVSRVLQQPQQLDWKGITIDAAVRIAEAVPRADTAIDINRWRRFSALQGSYWEHRQLEQDFAIDAVSADKGLALAVAQGIDIHVINAENVDAILPTLTHSASVITDITEWVSVGYEVTVPIAPIVIEAWQGSVWVVNDDATGAAGYFISGGLAGGSSDSATENWPQDIANILSQPYLSEVNSDPSTVAYISKLSSTDGQIAIAGTELDEELAVVVEDAAGRRVAGASLLFTSVAGGGTFNGADSITVTSDASGIAKASFTVAESTGDIPLYTALEASDAHVSRIGANIISVKTASAVDSNLSNAVKPQLQTPFTVHSAPGEAVKLVNNESGEVPPIRFGIEGNPLTSIRYSVLDSFDNPVSNEDITAVALPGITTIADSVINVESTIVDLNNAANCTVLNFHPECGEPSVSLTSNIFGVGITPILGKSSLGGAEFNFQISGASQSQTIVARPSRSSIAISSFRCVLSAGLCDAVKVGDVYRVPITIIVAWDPDDPIEFTDEVDFQSFVADGLGAPILSSVLTEETDNSRTYHVTLAGRAEAGISGFTTVVHYQLLNSPTQNGGIEEFTWQNLVSVDLQPGSSDTLNLNLEGVAKEVATINATYEPAAWTPLSSTVTVYENDTPIFNVPAKAKDGVIKASLIPSYQYDLNNNYSYRVFFNKGDAVRSIASDAASLTLSQAIIATADDTVNAVIDVDVPNGFVCYEEPNLNLRTTQEAAITLEVNNGLSSTTLIDSESLPGGEHAFTIPVNDLVEGLYSFTLTAVSAIDGRSETAEGVVIVRNRYTGALPIGHASVENIDLFDGHLSLARTDIRLPGRGPAIELQRSYSSNAGELSQMGVGWTHNYNSYVYASGCGRFTVAGGDGGGVSFFENGVDGQGAQTFTPAIGFHSTLKRTTEGFDFYSKDGTRYHYRSYNFSGPQRWHLEFIQDTNGNTTSLAYNPASGSFAELSAVKNSAGQTLSFEYDYQNTVAGTGPLIKRVSGGGVSVNYEYDALGRLTDATQNIGGTRSESYEYSVDSYVDLATAEHQFTARAAIKSLTDWEGHTTQYTHSPREVFISQDLRNATATLTFYDSVTPAATGSYVINYAERSVRSPSQTLLTTVNGPRATTTYTLNNYGSPIRIAGPAGIQTTTWASNDILPVSKTDENGIATDFQYDSFGNEISRHVGAFTPTVASYASIGQTIHNRPASITDRNGHTTSFSYDSSGNLTRKDYPDGSHESFSYAANGDLLSETDRLGRVTRYSYDDNGLPILVMLPIGSTQTDWNHRGLKLSETDANGNRTLFAYDAFDNLASASHALGATTFTYDKNNNKLTQTDENGNLTRWVYDGDNRIIEQITPVGRRLIDYNAAGDRISETDFNGNTTTFTYDGAGRQTSVVKPLGRIIVRTFDGAGNVLTETLPVGRVFTYEYDDLNRRTHVIDPLAGETVTTYDDVGNVITQTDAEGRTTTFVYDSLNRETSRIEPLRTLLTDYDANGNVISITDGNGQRTRFSYDVMNRRVSIIDPEDGKRFFEYDAGGNLTIETNERFIATRHSYGLLNRRSQTELAGFTTTFNYDAVGNLTLEGLPNGNAITRSYDSANRLVAVTDTLGSLEGRQYDANGNVTQQTDANGNNTVWTYDALNQVTLETRPFGAITTEYDALGNITSQTDLNGHATTFTYDLLDRVLRQDDAQGNAIRFSYDNVGNTLTRIDRNDNTTTFTYDDLNRLLTQTDAIGVQQFSYDNNDNLLTTTDKRGIVTRNTYDGNNRLLTTLRDSVLVLSSEYDGVGNVLFETDANNNKIAYIYDDRNLRITESRLLAAITTFSYDASGNVIEINDPENRTTTRSYDLRNRMLSETTPVATTHFTYDGNGNQLTKTRPLGNSWGFEYDAANRLIAVNDALSGSTTFTYDDNGNRLSQSDVEGNVTHYVYDTLNRRVSIAYPDAVLSTFGYDANGNVVTLTDPNGNDQLLTYDAFNREVARSYNGNASVSNNIESVTTSYDENNNVTQIIEGFAGLADRASVMSYDSFDRLVSKTDGFSKSITYNYDNNGNRTRVVDPDGNVTHYTYDALNRVMGVLNSQGGTGYTYDRSSLLTGIRYPNNTEADYSYDAAGRLLLIENRQNNAIVSRYDYSYDTNNNRTEQIETNGGAAETTTYAYDALDRLTAVAYPLTTVTYAYDGNYNRVSEHEVDNATSASISDLTLVYNERDQLTQLTDSIDAQNTISYQYDSNGNRTQKIQGSVTSGYVYDARDNLREATTGGSTVGQFLYDYQGLRIEKIGDRGTERYSYDDQSVLVQYDENNQTVAKYDYGPNRLLSLDHNTEGLQFYLTDALNSVVNLTATDGSVQARYQYDAWGNKRNEVGASFNRFAFTGYEEDTETALLYAKARYYDPDTGVFLTNDPFEGEADTPPSLHRYLYSYGNPTVFFDPTGQVAELVAIADFLKDRGEDSRLAAGQQDTTSGKIVGFVAGGGQALIGGAEFVTRGVNFVANLGVAKLDSERGKASQAELDDTFSSLDKAIDATGRAYDMVTEDPSGTAKKVSDAAKDLGRRVKAGDASALNSLSEGIAGLVVGAKGLGVAGSGVKTAGNAVDSSVKKLINRTDTPNASLVADGIEAAKGADETVDVFRVFGGDARAQGFSLQL